MAYGTSDRLSLTEWPSRFGVCSPVVELASFGLPSPRMQSTGRKGANSAPACSLSAQRKPRFRGGPASDARIVRRPVTHTARHSGAAAGSDPAPYDTLLILDGVEPRR